MYGACEFFCFVGLCVWVIEKIDIFKKKRLKFQLFIEKLNTLEKVLKYQLFLCWGK